MKKALLILSLLAGMGSTQAQIINGGFESWTPVGTFYSDPTGWFSGNMFTLFTGDTTTCRKTTQRYSGNYAAELLSIESKMGGVSPGFMLTIVPTSTRPKSLRFAYSNFAASAADTAYVTVTATKGNTQDTGSEIGFASMAIGGSNAAFRFVSLDIEYTSSETPDSLTVMFAVGDSTAGNRLIIDEVSFSAFPTSVSAPAPSAGVSVYPNPASGQLFVSAAGVLELTDLSGRTVLAPRAMSAGEPADVSGLPDGLYLYRFVSGAELKTGRVAVAH